MERPSFFLYHILIENFNIISSLDTNKSISFLHPERIDTVNINLNLYTYVITPLDSQLGKPRLWIATLHDTVYFYSTFSKPFHFYCKHYTLTRYSLPYVIVGSKTALCTTICPLSDTNWLDITPLILTFMILCQHTSRVHILFPLTLLPSIIHSVILSFLSRTIT